MRIIEIAGYMREVHVWQLLHDVAQAVCEKKLSGNISADKIKLEENRFIVANDSEEKSADKAKKTVETADQVWQLGATAFQLFMGCQVFNGQGRSAQKPDSPLPYMRKSMPELSTLVCRMLDYKAEKRPTMAEICELAETNINRLKTSKASRPKAIKPSQNSSAVKDFWPDEF